MKIIAWVLIPFIFIVSTSFEIIAQSKPDTRFEALNKLDWNQVFEDDGTRSWDKKWFLDGCRATVKNSPDGMIFSAGPIRGDNASHAVLWTKESFKGDIKIEFDYTRLDDIFYAVNILYIQATGIEEGPYKKDISKWSHLRTIPYMSHYFKYMSLLHVSYSAYPLVENLRQEDDYVRARRYPVEPGGDFATDTRLSPGYDNSDLFVPGVTYHFTCIKSGNDLFFEVKNDKIKKVFYWDTSGFDPVTEGRVGIRHMYTRAARYRNVRISVMQ